MSAQQIGLFVDGSGSGAALSENEVREAGPPKPAPLGQRSSPQREGDQEAGGGSSDAPQCIEFFGVAGKEVWARVNDALGRVEGRKGSNPQDRIPQRIVLGAGRRAH